MTFSAIQAAIRTWILKATALAESQVIWTKQGGPRPVGSFVDLMLHAPRKLSIDAEENDLDVGDPWEQDTVYAVGDRVTNGPDSYVCVTAGTSETDPDPPDVLATGPTGTGDGIADGSCAWDCASDEELVYTVSGARELVVSVRVFTPDVQGDAAAQALLGKIETAAQLPTVVDAFETAGIGLAEIGTTADTSDLLRAEFEGRAQCEVRFFTIDSMSERVGQITSATGTGTVNEGDYTVTTETP